MSATVSIVIPAYNYAHFLGEAIASALGQSYPEVEVLVVDDGSTDATPEVIAGFPSVVTIRQENRGLPMARNAGLAAARGDYVVFLDADDRLAPSSVARRIAAMEASPECMFAVGRTRFFSATDSEPPSRSPEWRLPAASSMDLALSHFNIAPPHAFMMRRRALDEFGEVFDPSLRACEDFDLWVRLAQRHGPPIIVADAWVDYRQHPDSMSRSKRNQLAHDAILCRRNLARLDGTGRWIGNRPTQDYLLPMLAAAAITARRLEPVDAPAAEIFVREHVAPLAERVLSYRRGLEPDLLPYVAMARHALVRLAGVETDATEGADPLAFRKSLAWEAMRESGPGRALMPALGMLRWDLGHLLHRLAGARRPKNPT